jgi:ribosomal protein L37AE/L43A
MLLAMRAWSKTTQASTSNLVTRSVAAESLPLQIEIRTKPKRKKARPASSTKSASNNQAARADRHEKPIISRKRNAKTETKSSSVHFQRKSKVRLSLIEKHLCPYCLEPVVQNDPRGIVECEICHTLHHADCWAIAGSCQVPHFTA